MTSIFLCLAAFLGYILSVHRFFKVPLAYSPLLISCGLIFLLFWSGLVNLLVETRLLLLCGGWLAAVYHFTQLAWWRERFSEPNERTTALLFIGGLGVMLVCSLSGRPSVVDDYSYWAIIGKSIIAFDSLPTQGTSIFPRHLTYTPGLALFHYFFHGFTDQQQLLVAYGAQNIFLLSLVIAATRNRKLSTSLTIISTVFILLVFFSGSVLQKLRVDHFLYLLAFTLLWLQLNFRFDTRLFSVIAIGLVNLFLIKEVGILVAMFLLCFLVFDLILHPELQKKQKLTYLFGCLLVALTLAGEKYFWSAYCTEMGFTSFHNSINASSLLNAFALTSNEASREAALIFGREFLLGAADGLKLPYLFWYVVLFLAAKKTLPLLNTIERKRYLLFFKLAVPFYLLYALMNYVMQYAVFGLGSTTSEPPSLERYLNIFFACFVLLVGITRLDKASFIKRSWQVGLIGVASLITIATSWPEEKEPYELEIEMLGEKMRPLLADNSLVCVTPGNPQDHYAGFRLLYLEFPHNFTVNPFPGPHKGKQLTRQLAKCDFLLVYRPDPVANRKLQPFANKVLHHGNLFQITSSQNSKSPLALTRRF